MLNARALIASALVIINMAANAAGPSGPPLEVKLVAIETGQMPAPNSPLVKRAAAAVRAAEARCTVQGEKLADQAMTVSREVQKQGQAASVVEVLEGLDAVLVDFKSPQDCASVLASYAAQRRDGATHSRAIVMQRALMKVVADASGTKR